MAKKLFTVVFLFSILGFFSCATTNPNTKNDLDWDGVYTGTIPGADSSISVKITLNKDNSYIVSYQYIDKSDDISTYNGTFTWKDDNTIQLDNNEIPPYYLVGKNTLIQLSMTGERIGGEHGDSYVLKKE